MRPSAPRSISFIFSFVLSCLLAGCPDPAPDPDPDDPAPAAAVPFRVPLKLSTDEAPEAVASAFLNTDAFPDLVTANRGDNTLTCWIADGSKGFKSGQRLLTGATEPRAVTIEDLDSDGALDIISANSGSSNLSVFYGAGDGTFAIAVLVALPAGAAPRDVAALDVDGDGHMDLVSANSGLHSISILLGDGTGAFAAPVDLPTGEGPRALLVADLNKDTRPDLITTDRDANALSLFLNEAGGLFRTRMAVPTGVNPRMTLAEDLDNDGWLDLVVSNPGSSNLGVHMGAGSGNLDPVVFIDTGANPTRIVLGDYTGDGVEDVLVVMFDTPDDALSSGQLQLLAGDGRGDFEPFDTYYGGPGIVALAAVDLNRDGVLDLAACNVGTDQLLIASGSRTLGLALERRFATGRLPRMVATADFNRDGKLDLAVANLDSADVTILLGDGNGAFGEGAHLAVGDATRALTTGDFNGDTFIDLAVTNLNASRVAILLGKGNGEFNAATFYAVREAGSTGTAEPRSIAVADLNDDGALDLVTGNAALDSVAVLLGDGKGAFGAAKEFDAQNFPLDVQLADINEDGNLDIVLVNGVDIDGEGTQTSALRVIPGKGDGTFLVANDVAYVTGAGPGSVAVADLDSDGDLDTVTSHNLLDTLQIYAGRGDGMFSAGGVVSMGNAPNAVGVADINKDGRPDLYSTSDDGYLIYRLHRNTLLYQNPVSIAVGSRPIEAKLIDINGDGFLDIVAPNRNTDDVSIILGKAL